MSPRGGTSSVPQRPTKGDTNPQEDDDMKRHKLVAITCAAAVAVAATPLAAAAASSASGPPKPARSHDVTFIKHLTDPGSLAFQGTTGGAARGQLTSQLITQTAPPTNQYEFLRFRWTIAARAHSFTAITDGTLNLITGEVEMDGTVTDGWHKGAEVLEKGQLTDPATYTFTGDIVLLVR